MHNMLLKKNQRLTEVITKVSITVCTCTALSWKIHIVAIHVTVSTWFWRQVLSYFLPIFLTLLDSWNIFSITFLWLRFSAVSSSITNFVGYVITLSGGYEQMFTKWSAPDTGTSCQWYIQICTGHMKIMSKNKLGESKHRSLLLCDSL